ncbi:MAG: hypothetical protein ACFCD0_26335 [Gemmataceae bacterium]
MKYFLALSVIAPLVCSGCVWSTGSLFPDENLALTASQKGTAPPIPPKTPPKSTSPGTRDTTAKSSSTAQDTTSKKSYVRGTPPRRQQMPANGTGLGLHWRRNGPIDPDSITKSNVHLKTDQLEAEMDRVESSGSSLSPSADSRRSMEPGPVDDIGALRR